MQKIDIILLEVITRNIATGSLIKKFYFNDRQGLNYFIALCLAKQQEVGIIRNITLKINTILQDFLLEKDILFTDFKIEDVFDSERNIVLINEISPDTCRFWDSKTLQVLDKDFLKIVNQILWIHA